MCQFSWSDLREQLGKAIPDGAVRCAAFWPPELPDIEYAVLTAIERLFPHYVLIRVDHHGPTPENCDPIYTKLGRRRINVVTSALSLAMRDLDELLERKAAAEAEKLDGHPA